MQRGTPLRCTAFVLRRLVNTMKTKTSVQSSANARMNDAKLAAEAAMYAIKLMELNGVCGATMRSLRNASNSLTQAVHEFNAYHNVVTTT